MTSDVTSLPDDADFTAEHLAAMQAARDGDPTLLSWNYLLSDGEQLFSALVHTFVLEMEAGLGQ